MAVVMMIWNRLVPTTTLARMRSTYSMTGIRMKPPPTPMMADRMPTNPPRATSGITLM